MTDTDRLIERLASGAQPVAPISSPLRRTAGWALFAVALVAVASTTWGTHEHAMRTLSDPGEAIEWLGSVLTGLCAAYAAFQISVPGRSGSWAWLPVLPLGPVAERNRRGLHGGLTPRLVSRPSASSRTAASARARSC
jgi:hypothetical protein